MPGLLATLACNCTSLLNQCGSDGTERGSGASVISTGKWQCCGRGNESPMRPGQRQETSQ